MLQTVQAICKSWNGELGNGMIGMPVIGQECRESRLVCEESPWKSANVGNQCGNGNLGEIYVEDGNLGKAVELT